jgi:hypothetical protein
MLETEGLAKALPGVESMTEGVKVYRQFYTVQKEQARGVLGIHVSRPNGVKEPPELLSSILNVSHVLLYCFALEVKRDSFDQL